MEEEPLLGDRYEGRPMKLASLIERIRRNHGVKANSGSYDRVLLRRRGIRIRPWRGRVRRRLRCWFFVRGRRLKASLSHWIAQLKLGKFHHKKSVLDEVCRNRRGELQRPCGATSQRAPRGFVPVYVGQEHQRFVIPVLYLHHPLFAAFLKAAEQEFGYHQNGGLLIPCEVTDFEEATLQMDSRILRRSLCALYAK